MSNHPFHQFLELVTFDQAVHGLLQKQEACKKEITQIERRMQEQDDVCAQFQRSATDARKVVDSLELEMKTLESKQKEVRSKLEHVVNYKESVSLQKEIERIGVQQHDLEDALLRAWNKLETAEREKNEQCRKVEAKKQEASAELEKTHQEQDAVMAELKTHESQREEKKRGIPEEWLQKYETMRLLVTNPIVPMESDSCSACFHELSHQELIRLTRGALLECKVCFRFLYHKNNMHGV